MKITIQVAGMRQIQNLKLNGNILEKIANKVKSLFSFNRVVFA